jgi:amidohydrolase
VTASLIELRRALHRIPELGFEEEKTSALLGEAVRGLGQFGSIARTGITLDFGVQEAAHRLLLRADMDALPIEEETGLSFASTHPERMHACGHDAHMAALAVACREIDESSLGDVAVRVLFQPAEEGKGGARLAIEEGVLDDVDAAFGIHVWNELPVGTVALTRGGVMAGVVEVEFVIRGRGGHGALPHRTADPVVAAAQLVLALQTVVSRHTDPSDSVVLTLGSIHAGDAFNVIPDQARILGTVRAFDPAVEVEVETAVRRIASGIGEATGTSIDVEWRRYTIPTVNDEGVRSMVMEAASRVAGVDTVLEEYRTMAGEDFGEIIDRVPGCFALVGSGGEGAEPHHSPRFELDEAALEICRDLHLEVIRAFIEQQRPE